jgi:hypothetical protein
MSRYLIQRIEQSPRIEVHFSAELKGISPAPERRQNAAAREPVI